MKNGAILMVLCWLLASCGGSGTMANESASDAATEVSAEEESAIVEQAIETVQTDIEEVKKNTEESLQEVDSLLENF